MTDLSVSSFVSVMFDQDIPHIFKTLLELFILDIFRFPIWAALAYFTIRYFDKKKVKTNEDNKLVSYSLNDIQDDYLELSHISLPTDIKTLFPNVFAQGVLMHLVKHARPDSPLLNLPAKIEKYVTGAIQTVLSIVGAAAALRAAAGLDTVRKWFVFMLAFEQYEDTPFRKIRIIITSLERLNNIPEDDTVTPEEPHQLKRLRTMRLVRDTFNAMPKERQQMYMVRLRF